MRGAPARLLLFFAALLGLASTARADREAASFYADRGEKALVAKDADAAQTAFRRSLDEDGTFRPARFGLARALIAGGKPVDGVRELRQFIAEMKAEATPPAAWDGLLARAQRMLEEIDASGAEIDKTVERYADTLIALGKKWQAKDPLVAERALRRALQLRPGDPEAVKLLAVVDSIPKGKAVALFNGADFSGWVDAELPYFKAGGGVITGDVERGSKQIRTTDPVSGEFDVSMEARVLSDSGSGDPMIALLAGLKGSFDFIGVGLIAHKVYFFDRHAEKDRKVLYKETVEKWGNPLDLTAWNAYTLRFRKDEIIALINGIELGRCPRLNERAEGFIGLYAQSAKVEFRNVKLQRY